jgi:hypothetical protein
MSDTPSCLLLRVSQGTYDEVKRLMEEFEYDQVFHPDPLGMLIDLNGFGMVLKTEESNGTEGGE